MGRFSPIVLYTNGLRNSPLTSISGMHEGFLQSGQVVGREHQLLKLVSEWLES